MVRIGLSIAIVVVLCSCQMPTSGPLPTFDVALVAGVGRATVRWSPVSGADYYQVTCAPGPTLETTDSSAVVEGLAPGIDAHLTVTALTSGRALAQGTAYWTSAGWTWVADPVVAASFVTSDVTVFSLGDGDYLAFVTESLVTIERLERLRYGPEGLTRTMWTRTTTKPPKTGEPAEVLGAEVTASGTWITPWQAFSMGPTERTTFSSDRATFTLDSAPTVVWRLARSLRVTS